jgi:hypothetical protein
MSSATPPRALSEEESHARPLSHWLQLMLAEIAAKRDAQQRACEEEERRRAEREAADRGDAQGQATRS